MNQRVAFSVPPCHPALPGHFPGRPLVPGVWLLEEVVAALERLRGPFRLGGLPQVKFLQPLLPGESAVVEFDTVAGGRVRFRVSREATLLASGELELLP